MTTLSGLASMVRVKFLQSTTVIPNVYNHCMPRITSTLLSSNDKKSSLMVGPDKVTTTPLQIPLPWIAVPVPMIAP